jgi:uncharacterized protein YjbI with pentapeptide repeats/energy-coupling factor transporter ATP-binding protein EcfA2
MTMQAQRAAVRPRVRSAGGETLLLEDEVRSLADAGERGYVAILGPVGSGKTTALRHLAAVLPTDCGVTLLDEADPPQLDRAADGLVVLTFPSRSTEQTFAAMAAAAWQVDAHLAMYQLVPWGEDDLIEYLLAVHRPRCRAVMARLRPEDRLLLQGVPELWRIVLDRLAEDDSLPDARRALHRHLEEHLSDTDLLERARSACLNAVVAPDATLVDTLTKLARPGFAAGLLRVLRHPAAQLLLAAERVAADLHGQTDCDCLARHLPRDLVRATAALVRADERALCHLHALLAGPSWSHSMAASLLHAAGAAGALRDNCPSELAGAYLDGVVWPGGQLAGADFTEADLSGADLAGANLAQAHAHGALFRGANLRGACLEKCAAAEADLSGAILAGARGDDADFEASHLDKADFSGSAFRRAIFTRAILKGAKFHEADLARSHFVGADLTDADFSGADLGGAVLSGLDLREAHWEGTEFTCAHLDGCDLEYLSLPAADFFMADLRGALLTGSAMFGANLRGACLRDTGLADVEWEGADLRGADLRGSSFHMGSSRSGLVGSPIACEGSRTGFYTDDYEEQTYKAPEEIRKANLCGADLRGALLDNVDFYLVDLRGATYDPDQETHLRRCGAILGTRV